MIAFELSTEQKRLQQRLKRLSKEKLHSHSLWLDSEKPGPIDKTYREFISDHNLNALIVPKEYGGCPVDHLTLSLVTEEIAYGCTGLASIYGATVHAVSALLIGGSHELKEAFLPHLLESPGVVAACCITEEKGGSDTVSFSTTARMQADHYVLNGSKTPIINAGNADFYVVWASSDSEKGRAGIETFVIPQNTPGLTFGAYHDKPGVRNVPTAAVFLRDVIVPKSNLIGIPGSGYLLLMQTLDLGRAFFGAVCVGLARAALEESVVFAKNRAIRNRPIFKNQAISFTLAELATEVDAARLLVWRACRLMDLGMDYTRESSMAKLFASEVALRATSEAMLIFGQKVHTQSHLMSKWQRDAQSLQIMEGTSHIQKRTIASQL